MRIKISKVVKDLNVGVQTIKDFLERKGIDVDVSSPNSRIDEDVYNILVQQYGDDKAQKQKSDDFTNERMKDKAKNSPEKEVPKTKAPTTPKAEVPTVEEMETAAPEQQAEDDNSGKSNDDKPATGVKVVGKIDLATVNPSAGKKAKKATSAQTKQKAEAVKAEPAAEQKAPAAPDNSEMPEQEPEKQPLPEKKDDTKAENKSEATKTGQTAKVETEEKPATEAGKKAEKKTKAATPEVPAEQMADDKPEEAVNAEANAETPADDTQQAEPEVFKTESQTIIPGFKVVGKIDVDSINSSTRPRRKSKEERRNERIAKSRQEGEGKRKRNRIGREKIDIEKSAAQITTNPTRNGNKNKQQSDNRAAQQQTNKKKKKERRPLNPEVNEQDVQKQVKETLAMLTSKKDRRGAKLRREKRDAVREEMREEAAQQAAERKTLKLSEFVTANDLAMMMNIPVNKVIATCMNIGIMVSINQRLDAEAINIVAEEFGFKTEYQSADEDGAIVEEEDKPEDLQPRPPVVTVMGHVDHGKTSLLDYIRNSNVIAGEAGGITQHIGAYNVKLPNGRRITFLDTPGHEAFTAMRARGAKVTDIVIIIVAADDSVMPQTVEALNHSSAAGVPIVFAINKIDKDGANPDKIKEELANMNYLVEDWGGSYQSQDISAKKGIGVAELMDKVLLEADMLELKANPNRKATGSIIESSLDKGRGYLATVLVDNGTLRVGDILLAGKHYGKVKAMFNERNQAIKEAGPASPALVLGLNGAPTAGDKFNVMETDHEARQIANRREQLQREQGLRTQKRITLDDIRRRIIRGEFHELNIIVKGDVDGSIEALSDSLIKLSTPEVQVNVIHKAVGAISESDVTLAAASDAYIIGFQVRPSVDAKRLAAQEGVEIRIYSIIYDAIEEVKSAMEGMLSPDIKEEIMGSVEVKEVFHISKIGTIAGAIVREGKIKRPCKVRVIRDGIVRFTGNLASLKRFKDDVKEVASGYECGLSVQSYNDLEPGDIIEPFEEVEVQKTL